jgi:hypothetical protein
MYRDHMTQRTRAYGMESILSLALICVMAITVAGWAAITIKQKLESVGAQIAAVSSVTQR